ncbi:MAG TPA: hypothetical protein VK784_09875, partial [Pseudonocardiaceae bacterium]|nr:hypothetical protein [Pseudonocardiaceae bacterium]
MREMRSEMGRQRRLRRSALIGLTAMAAIAVGGSVAATQAQATPAAAARPAGGGGGLSISKAFFGNAVEPYTGKETAVYRYTLSNARGMSVDILTYGGIVQQINLPGRNGHVADVVLGFGTLADYVAKDSPPVTANGGPYFGELIGRYGNRIAKGVFTLNQPGVGPVTYTLPVNNGVNSLHGGLVGFGNHIWADQAIQTSSEVGVQLTLVSPNGDQAAAAGSPGCPNGCTGYPAVLKTVVTYTLNNKDQLGIHYSATDESSNLNTVLNLTNHSYFNLAGEGTGSAANQLAIHYNTTDESTNLNTVINLTNHSYFNLAGEASPAGSAYGQLLQINANKYSPTDTTQIPLGYQASVFGTPFDFTKPQTIGS